MPQNIDDMLFMVVSLVVGTKNFIVNHETLVKNCTYEKVI